MSWISEEAKEYFEIILLASFALLLGASLFAVPELGVSLWAGVFLTYAIVAGPEKLRWFALGVLTTVAVFGLAVIISHWHEIMRGVP